MRKKQNKTPKIIHSCLHLCPTHCTTHTHILGTLFPALFLLFKERKTTFSTFHPGKWPCLTAQDPTLLTLHTVEPRHGPRLTKKLFFAFGHSTLPQTPHNYNKPKLHSHIAHTNTSHSMHFTPFQQLKMRFPPFPLFSPACDSFPLGVGVHLLRPTSRFPTFVQLLLFNKIDSEPENRFRWPTFDEESNGILAVSWNITDRAKTTKSNFSPISKLFQTKLTLPQDAQSSNWPLYKVWWPNSKWSRQKFRTRFAGVRFTSDHHPKFFFAPHNTPVLSAHCRKKFFFDGPDRLGAKSTFPLLSPA